MDRVKSQAAVVSQLLFDPKTGNAYKDVFLLTGKIIKEVAFLIWLLICSVFVFAAWFGDVALNSGRNVRIWWQDKQMETVDGNEAAATGQAFLNVSQNGASFLLDKAREQLGLDKIERPAKAETSKAVKSTVTNVAKKATAAATATADKVAAVADAKTMADKKASESKDSSEAPVAEKH